MISLGVNLLGWALSKRKAYYTHFNSPAVSKKDKVGGLVESEYW